MAGKQRRLYARAYGQRTTTGEEAPMTRYADSTGRIYEAGKGLGQTFMTMRDGHRVKSSALPVRDTLHKAQADLDVWAVKRGLTPLETATPSPRASD